MSVETEREADELAKIPFVRLAVHEGRMEPIEVGSDVSLRACVGLDVTAPDGNVSNAELAAIERETGRPCPRVELEPANHLAAAAFGRLVREDIARAFPVWWAGATRGLSEAEADRVLERALTAMGDPRVTEALHPKPQQPAPRRKGLA